MRLAVFDCDGTLVDSGASICAAMDLAFVGERLAPPEHQSTRRVVGLSLVEAMAALLPGEDPALHARLADAYKAAFTTVRGHAGFEEPLYPGVVETLAELDAAGWLLGVATGKSARGLVRCLAAHGLGERFVTLQTADHHPSKPHPAMLRAALAQAGATHAVMVGDTVYDIEMARAADVPSVGVAWGYHAPVELTQAGATAVAETWPDLPALLEAASAELDDAALAPGRADGHRPPMERAPTQSTTPSATAPRGRSLPPQPTVLPGGD